MVYARAYYKGKVIAELTNIGYTTVEAVMKDLIVNFPEDIPFGAKVHFRITNCDTQREAVYEKFKGKGF